MIKLKDLLFENEAPDIFVPRRMDDRVERMIKNYVRNGSKGNLNLIRMNLIELPEILSTVTVNGAFDCSYNLLKSLSGAPQHVHGHFNCRYNKLKSLSGAPQLVHGAFDCSYNKLKSLSGAPQQVHGFFSCHSNLLESLSGAPQLVHGHFNCRYNKLKSLSGAPQHVGGDFNCQENILQFTEAEVRAVCDVKGKVFV